MKRNLISLCGDLDDPSSCPQVNILSSGVSIGEKGNIVRLKKEEWNKLVKLIKSGKLKKV